MSWVSKTLSQYYKSNFFSILTWGFFRHWFLEREGRREEEEEREKHQHKRDASIGCFPHVPLPGLRKTATKEHGLDQEMSPQVFSEWASTLPTEQTQPCQSNFFLYLYTSLSPWFCQWVIVMTSKNIVISSNFASYQSNLSTESKNKNKQKKWTVKYKTLIMACTGINHVNSSQQRFK